MKLKRLLQIIRLNVVRTSGRRGQYLKTVFKSVGSDVSYQPRTIPLYPELIKFHNNIIVASGVMFITHDAIHAMLNRLKKNDFLHERRMNSKNMTGGGGFKERVGCIEIMDNVFIGSRSVIMYGVRIGSNVIVGANTLVNKDLEPDAVYAGIPAKKICSFDEFLKKRNNQNYCCTTHNQNITESEIQNAWDAFDAQHSV